MEDILKFVGGSAVLVAGVAWITRAIIGQLLNKDIETFKSKLKSEAERESHLLMQKIGLYKEVATPLIALVARVESNGGLISKEELHRFDQKRMETIALLVMFAPEEVCDSYNELIDYIYDSFDGEQTWTFNHFRDMALKFLSGIRKDLGIYEDEIIYKGHR